MAIAFLDSEPAADIACDYPDLIGRQRKELAESLLYSEKALAGVPNGKLFPVPLGHAGPGLHGDAGSGSLPEFSLSDDVSFFQSVIYVAPSGLQRRAIPIAIQDIALGMTCGGILMKGLFWFEKGGQHFIINLD